MNNRTILNYGDSLFGKTSFLASAVYWGLQQDPSLIVRLYTCENHDSLDPLIEAGVVELWVLDGWDDPFDAIDYAVQGYWPVDPKIPNSKLIPPTPEILAKRWMRCYEGITSFSDFCMGGYSKGGLAAKAGRGERVGPAEETISFKAGHLMVGGNCRTHYNITQRFMHGAIIKNKNLPGHNIWTGHEVKASDDRTERPIIGPEVAGEKATPRVTRWFSDTVHSYRHDDIDKVSGSIKSDYRIYLKPHVTPDMKTIPHKACMRVPALVQEEANKIVPDYIKNDRESYTKLMDIRDKLDQLSDATIKRLKERR